ncbi:MAG: AsmA family protein [Pseudomonadota bacterium]|nr:AsmA family protein [Pseudomonadota bacterium]
MKATKIVLWTALLVLLALAGAVAYLPAYLEDHRDVLEAAATQALGRPVEIEGGVTLAWSLRPTIAVEGIRIQNPSWSQNPQLARAERVEVQLDLGALLHRRIEVTRLVLQKADVHLEAGPQGANNWTFGSGGQSDIGFRIDLLRVLDSTLVFQPAQGMKRRFGISRLDLRGVGSRKLAFEAAGTYQDLPISVSATSGHAGGVQAQRWPFTVRAKTADATIEATGSSNAPFDVSGIEAEVTLKGQNLRSLQRLISPDRLPEGPFQIAFHLARDDGGYRFRNIEGSIDAPALLGPIAVTKGEAGLSVDNGLSASVEGSWRQKPATLKMELAKADPQTHDGPRKLDVTATLGDTVLSGDLGLALDRPRPRITGDLSSAKFDLRDFSASEQPAPGHGPRKAWSESPLPIAALTAFDADLTLAAELVASERLQAKGLRVHASLENGRLQLDRLSASLPGLTLTGQGTLDTRAQPPTLEVAMDADRVQLPQAVPFVSPPPKTESTFQKVSLRAKARGETPEALIGTLDGKLTADAAHLRLPGTRRGESTKIRLTKPTVTFTPGKGVRLRTRVAVKQRELALDLAGGPLADLLSGDPPWPNIGVVARGKLQREKVEVRGDVGPLPSLLAGRDLHVNLAAHHRGVNASLKGTLARFDGLRGSKLAVKASSASLSALGPLLGVDLPDGQPFKATARLEGDDHRLDVRNLKASSGGSDIEGKLRIHLNAKTRIEATLASRSIDLTPYLAPRSDGPGDVKSSLSEALPLELLHVLDGALDLKADHVRIGDFGVDDGNLSATLDAGHLRLSANAGQERLAAEVELKPEKTRWRLNLKHKGNLDLGWLIEEENAASLSQVPAALDVRLSSVGDSLQTLLGSANGHVELVLGAGQLNKKVAALPLGDILVTLLNALNPINQPKPFANLECAVFQLEVADGIATSTRGLAVQTEAINVLGGGALNLRSNEIELHFKTAQRKGIGISLLGVADRFIYITGTLQEPTIAIDPKGLLIHGGAAWATGGLSLLYDQLVKRLTAFSNPCDAVMRKGERHGD